MAPHFPHSDRPWESPAGMYACGIQYFEQRKNEGKHYTISGLALHLGMSYGKFSSYGGRSGFAPVVALLKSHILNQAEEALYDKETVNGAKFHAAQLGMAEKSIVESRNTNVTASLSIDALKGLPDADLATLLAIAEKLAVAGGDRSGDSEEETEQDQNPVSGDGAISS